MKHDPKAPVGRTDARASIPAFEHRELLTKGLILQRQIAV
jgi:hypothetical protein